LPIQKGWIERGIGQMIVALFEDETYVNFLPLAYTRPVFDLRSGMFSFIERVQRVFPDSGLMLFTRDYIVPTLRRRIACQVNQPAAIDDDMLLINATLIVDEKVKQLAERKLSVNSMIKQQGRIALARLSQGLAKKYAEEMCKPVPRLFVEKLARKCKRLESSKLRLFDYPWDLVNNCGGLIKEDYVGFDRLESKGSVDDKVAVYGDKGKVFVGEGSSIEAFVMLDARDGPIYIGKGTNVHSGSRITGPAHIGDKVIIPTGLIREGCSIGSVCRVGGELEETIIQGYTNKYHTGFIGHAYIGEWVNLGAGTTNSDLKNTYGTVQVVAGGRKVDTGHPKVGCFIGDHVKASIGTEIYTGKTIGLASHVHGFVTDDVPAFTIWAKSLHAKPVELKLESAIKTQERAFSRRGVKQTREDVALLRKLFEMTVAERKKASVSKGKFAF
jgi:UDP-N-acetylglucosamine diphosphorylase/glucosamine-1-phosphate N-acetyltransferase